MFSRILFPFDISFVYGCPLKQMADYYLLITQTMSPLLGHFSITANSLTQSMGSCVSHNTRHQSSSLLNPSSRPAPTHLLLFRSSSCGIDTQTDSVSHHTSREFLPSLQRSVPVTQRFGWLLHSTWGGVRSTNTHQLRIVPTVMNLWI